MDVITFIVGFLGQVTGHTVRALLPLLGLLVVVGYLERRQGSDTSRYFRRHFAHDVFYAWFYDSGAFAVLGSSLIYAWVQERVGFMRMGLLEGLPLLVVAPVVLVVNDFIAYWLHRAEHKIPFLWQFHSVHHSAEEMNFLTTYRMHPVSKLYWGIAGNVLLVLMGVPPAMWFAITLAQTFLTTVQHADLDWSYGPLHPILVSPVYHRLHHSRSRRDYDKNYSQLFCWDYLFGTVNASLTPPAAVGVEGIPSEPTLFGQFLGPFRRLARTSTPIPPQGDPKKELATRS